MKVKDGRSPGRSLPLGEDAKGILPFRIGFCVWGEGWGLIKGNSLQEHTSMDMARLCHMANEPWPKGGWK